MSTSEQLPSKELLPCPFCGSAGRFYLQTLGREIYYEATCSGDCEVGAGYEGSEEAAAAKWNKRVLTPEPCADHLRCTCMTIGNSAQIAKADPACPRHAPPPCSPWQPIETAPRDPEGSCIVAVPNYTNNEEAKKRRPFIVGEAHFVRYEHGAGCECQWFWAGEDPSDHWGPSAIYPTHWQPLPDAPGVTKEVRT